MNRSEASPFLGNLFSFLVHRQEWLDKHELQSYVDEDEFPLRAGSRVSHNHYFLFRVQEVEFAEFGRRVLCPSISTPDERRINHPELFK